MPSSSCPTAARPAITAPSCSRYQPHKARRDDLAKLFARQHVAACIVPRIQSFGQGKIRPIFPLSPPGRGRFCRWPKTRNENGSRSPERRRQVYPQVFASYAITTTCRLFPYAVFRSVGNGSANLSEVERSPWFSLHPPDNPCEGHGHCSSTGNDAARPSILPPPRPKPQSLWLPEYLHREQATGLLVQRWRLPRSTLLDPKQQPTHNAVRCRTLAGWFRHSDRQGVLWRRAAPLRQGPRPMPRG